MSDRIDAITLLKEDHKKMKAMMSGFRDRPRPVSAKVNASGDRVTRFGRRISASSRGDRVLRQP